MKEGMSFNKDYFDFYVIFYRERGTFYDPAFYRLKNRLFSMPRAFVVSCEKWG